MGFPAFLRWGASLAASQTAAELRSRNPCLGLRRMFCGIFIVAHWDNGLLGGTNHE